MGLCEWGPSSHHWQVPDWVKVGEVGWIYLVRQLWPQTQESVPAVVVSTRSLTDRGAAPGLEPTRKRVGWLATLGRPLAAEARNRMQHWIPTKISAWHSSPV